jgi:hypothetical protein
MPSLSLPAVDVPAGGAFATAFVLLVTPQLPLTFGNAVVAVGSQTQRDVDSGKDGAIDLVGMAIVTLDRLECAGHGRGHNTFLRRGCERFVCLIQPV